MKRLLRTCLAGVAALAASTMAHAAETYPTRPITIIVPYAAGGPSDAIARLLGQSMSGTLGQQIVIENVAGAGGTAAAAREAKAAPDGYTLLIHHVALAAGASLYPKLTYDTSTAFEPLGLVNYGPMVVSTKKDYAAGDAPALLAKLKADGTTTSFAHAGVGSNSHLCGLLLQRDLKTKFTEVAYKGTGPAMNDVIGGQVDLICDQSTSSVPQVTAGTIKGMAVTSKDRLPVLKGLPTLQEAGLPGFEFVIWHGLYAPAGTSPEIVAKLNEAIKVTLKDPNVLARFADVGTQTFAEGEWTPAAHKALLDKEIANWKAAIGEGTLKN